MALAKTAKAMLGAVAVVAVVELSLDVWLATPPPLRGLPSQDPLLFLLGTSRTMAGLNPSAMEDELSKAGIASPFVASVSDDGITTIGQFDLYMSELRPIRVDAGRRCVLAIEVRCSGLNDSYANPQESAKFARGEYREYFAEALGSGELSDQLVRFDLGAAARTLVSFAALGSGRETLHRVERRLAASEAPWWATGAKGFRPYVENRHADLDVELWRHHYVDVLLKRWAFGERQFPMLKLLAAQARRDGCDVVLYVMPVTDLQHSFWKPGERERVLFAVRAWARNQRFELFDFDTGSKLTRAEFFDTHHLAVETAERFSREFATKVFLPRLKR